MEKNDEKLVDRKVTYTLEYGGEFYIIENVPARVNEETGEQYFSPKVVEKLQQTISKKQVPIRTIQTPVYDFGN